jgi:glycyl-tRNA synthetase beta chain
MAELLLELFSEEIPARMQSVAADRLMNAVESGLNHQNVTYDAIHSYATPRRITLVIEGLPETQAASSEEKRGPRKDAPDSALEGFLRSTGLTKNELEIRNTDKGEFYFAVTKTSHTPMSEVVTKILQEALAKFSWPKSMRWGAHNVRWVRPLHRILCLLDHKILPVAYGHIAAGDETSGHRFMSPEVFKVKNFEDYRQKLRKNNVILCAKERKEVIKEEAERLAAAHSCKLVVDNDLLDEITGLVEWPVPLIGPIEARFMALPAEVLQTTMRTHQKYFALSGKGGTLAPYFMTVANIESEDKGQCITAGNERVLRARLEDAKFFWDQDRRHGLDSRLPAPWSLNHAG